jgi:hypothetical protein
MGEECSTVGRDEKCVEDFGQKMLREEPSRKTYLQIGG